MDENRKFSWQCSSQGWNQEVLFVPRMKTGSIISDSVRLKERKQEVILTIFAPRMKLGGIIRPKGWKKEVLFLTVFVLIVFVLRKKTGSISDSIRPKHKNKKNFWQCSSQWKHEVFLTVVVSKLKPGSSVLLTVFVPRKQLAVFLTVLVLRMTPGSISESVPLYGWAQSA